METTIIGIDPHKRSHTAVVLDQAERIATELRASAGRRQLHQLLAWAPPGPRLWAVENANGLGRLISRQLVAHGEHVVDVPASLAARTRKLSGHSSKKTDAFDARSVVIAACHHGGLRTVVADDDAVLLALLLARRDRLVQTRKRTINQLHALLTNWRGLTTGRGSHTPLPTSCVTSPHLWTVPFRSPDWCSTPTCVGIW